ncbi:MAG: sodium:solute symporter family protein [Myxococcota bacterium]
MIDLAMVGAFVVWALAAGLRARREASTDLGAYFLANRKLSFWASGFSMTATQYAADTPLLATGLIATGGIFAMWRLWIYGLAFLVLGFVLASAWWRSGVITDAEFCELRYGGRPAVWLRGVKAVYYGLIFNCAVLAMVLVAAVRIAEPFLLWDQWLPPALFDPIVGLVRAVGVPLASSPSGPEVWIHSASNLVSLVCIYVFTTLYSATGGLRSVVSTDLGQLAILTVATVLYAGFAVEAAGGLGALREGLVLQVGAQRAAELLAFDPISAPEAGGTLLAVLGLQWLVQMNSDGTGYLAQRCMACRSAREARRAPVLFAFAQVGVRSLVWLPLMVALLIVFPLEPGQGAGERELTFVRGIQSLLPPGVRGLILVGMLAALASTIDTHLNWGASYLSNDLYHRLLCRGLLGRDPGAREVVWVARLSSPVLVALSLAVMTRLGSIQEAWHATLLLGAGLGIPLLLRWLWWRANAWGELAAIAASGVAAPLLMAGVANEASRLLAIASIGTIAAVVGSLATRAESESRVKAFYDRVRPSGFWRKTGSARRLGRQLMATVAAAGTLFCSLVAVGTWLVGGTPPAGLSTAFWIALNAAAALLLIPLWWIQLSSDPDAREAHGTAAQR